MVEIYNTTAGEARSAERFMERALTDFALTEAYALRSARERDSCVAWVEASESTSEEEDRVSQLLDALWFDRPLPPDPGDFIAGRYK